MEREKLSYGKYYLILCTSFLAAHQTGMTQIWWMEEGFYAAQTGVSVTRRVRPGWSTISASNSTDFADSAEKRRSR